MLDVLDRLGLRPDYFLDLQAPLGGQHLDRSHPPVREVTGYTNKTHPLKRANLVLARSETRAQNGNTQSKRQWSLDAYLMENRSQISKWLVVAGKIMLAIGALFVVIGLSGRGESVVQVDGGMPSLVSAGLGTMLVSSIWIFFARLALPPGSIIRPPRSKD